MKSTNRAVGEPVETSKEKIIPYAESRQQPAPQIVPQKLISKIAEFFIPAVLLFSLYYTFRIEIENYWDQLFTDSLLKISSENNQLGWFSIKMMRKN